MTQTFDCLDCVLARKSLPTNAYSYKLAGPSNFGMDVIIDEDADFNEGKMSAWVPYADGNRRDGVGDKLEVGGIVLERHQKNALVLFDHGKQIALPIGSCRNPETAEYENHIDQAENRARLNCFFYQGKGIAGVSNSDEYNHAVFCHQLYDLYVKRFVKGGSIGYQIVKALPLQPNYETGTPQGLHLLSVLMLEGSVVVMPANMDTVGKSYDGIQEMARKILCLPNVCGKPLAPVLVKSLSAYAPEKKAMLGFEGREEVPLKDVGKTNVPPAVWKPGVGALKAIRLKHRRKMVPTVFVEYLDRYGEPKSEWVKVPGDRNNELAKWKRDVQPQKIIKVHDEPLNTSIVRFKSLEEEKKALVARVKSVRLRRHEKAINWKFWLDVAISILSHERTWQVISRLPVLYSALKKYFEQGLTPQDAVMLVLKLKEIHDAVKRGGNYIENGKSLNGHTKGSRPVGEYVYEYRDMGGRDVEETVDWGKFLAVVLATVGVAHLSLAAINKLRELFRRGKNPQQAAQEIKNVKGLVLEAGAKDMARLNYKSKGTLTRFDSMGRPDFSHAAGEAAVVAGGQAIREFAKFAATVALFLGVRHLGILALRKLRQRWKEGKSPKEAAQAITSEAGDMRDMLNSLETQYGKEKAREILTELTNQENRGPEGLKQAIAKVTGKPHAETKPPEEKPAASKAPAKQKPKGNQQNYFARCQRDESGHCKSLNGEVKSLSDLRRKYRTNAKGFRRRVKSSQAGASIIRVHEKDLSEAQQYAESRGLKFMHQGGGRVKLVGDDAAADEVAVKFGRPMQ